MEATSVTGPAKNLLGYCRWLQSPEGQRTGLQIAVATFDRGSGGKESNAFADAARSTGIETYVIQERFRYDFAALSQLKEIVARASPTIIQTHNNKSHLLVKSLSSIRQHCSWLAFHHGDTHTTLRQRAYNEIDRLTLRGADRVITVCQAFVPLLISRGVKPDRVRVLHNAAAPAQRFSDADRVRLREELGIGVHEAVILVVGRLSREKGQGHLIEALARLSSTMPAWRLVVLGTGPELDRLRALAHTLGVASRILFVGFRADVAPFYGIADVVAIPSLTEGSSNVLLEAMAAGSPIVATQVGGNPEIALHEETALLVPPADPSALTGALERLLTDRGLASRLTAAAQTRAMVEFSEQGYRQRLSSVYAEAIGAGA